MPERRAKVVALPETTFAGDPSVVTYDIDIRDTDQVILCLTHSEGTSATALTYDMSLLVDASATPSSPVSGLYSADAVFPYPEETVGATASGVTTVTVNQGRRDIPSDFLDGDLPMILVPFNAGPFKVRLTLTETASAAGTIKGFALLLNT